MRRSAEEAPGRVWRAAWILPVCDGPLREGAVAVRGGAIAAVGPAAEVLAAHPDLPVEDLGAAVLAPGLVDVHCHLEWSLLDGALAPADFGPWLAAMMALRARMTPDDHLLAARHGALRALRAGTTTLLDSGPTGAGVRALTESGQRGAVHLEVFGRETGVRARAAAAAVAAALERLDAAAGARVRVGVSPHAPYTVGPDLWRELRARPGLARRPWATHIAESAAEERAISDDEGPLAEMFAAGGMRPGHWPGTRGAGVVPRMAARGALAAGMVAAHCVRVDAADAATLAAAGVGVAHCPRSNAHLHCGRSPLETLRAAGVTVGLGTDSPASGGDYDLRAELRAARALHAGRVAIDDAAALRMITADAARAAGMEGRVGALAPGMRADLVALRGTMAIARHVTGNCPDPDEALSLALDPASAVETVVVDGEVLLRDGRPTAPEADAIDARAAEAAKRLC